MVDNDSDDKVVKFPKTAEERRALRKAKDDLEKQRLINVFIDEAGGDQALFHTRDDVAYADLIVAGHRETWQVRSKQFRHAYLRYLQRQFDRLVNTAEQPLLAMMIKSSMNKTAINHAIDDFERRAICSSITRDVCVRVAGYGDEIYIDLCNDDWSAVRITPAGWSIVESPPVRFERTTGMLPLPFPERGGKIEALRPLLNTTDADFPLVIADLLAALYPSKNYPVLVLYAVQGAAKTYFLRKLRSLIDPHRVATCPLPSSGRDLFIAARNSHLQAFENVSKLSDQMSDHLCRLATGGGLRLRKLFKDSDEVFFHGARPICFEGISNVISRGDLQSRAIIFQLEALQGYITLRELDREFERQRPRILGALLDMMVRGLQMLPVTRFVSSSRLPDFEHWCVACGVANFEMAFTANREAAIQTMLSFDPVGKAVWALAEKKKKWTGIMADLLEIIGPAAGIKAPKKLSDELRRLRPALQTVGVYITFQQRTAEHRPFTIELKK
jgi:hypothetical protein